MRAVLATLLFIGVAPAFAEPSDNVVICKVIIDRTAEFIRTGDLERARLNRPKVEKCERILKDDELRDARRIVDQYDAATKH